MAHTVAELRKQINQMQSVHDAKGTSAEVKATLKRSLDKANALLQEMETPAPAAKASPAVKRAHAAATAAKEHKNKGKLKSALDQIKALISTNKDVKAAYKGTPMSQIVRDSVRPAKAPGKRKSASGETYYENRSNRADITHKKFPKLEEGGDVDDNTTVIAGVIHTKEPGMHLDKMKKFTRHENAHPLGDVYEKGGKGYVASGYDWYSFPIKDLKKLVYQRESGEYEKGGKINANSSAKTILEQVIEALKSERLKIVKGGKKKYSVLFINVEELGWGRNNSDGYKIDVYNNKDERHIGTIMWVNHKEPEIYFVNESYEDGGEVNENWQEDAAEQETEEVVENIVEQAIEEGIPVTLDVQVNKVTPDHFGSGENINVFGYDTVNFDNCREAGELFNEAKEKISTAYEPGTPMFKSMSENLRSFAERVDSILGIEKRAVEDGAVYEGEIVQLFADIQLTSVYNYRSGSYIDTTFLNRHLTPIISRFILPEDTDNVETEEELKEAAIEAVAQEIEEETGEPVIVEEEEIITEPETAPEPVPAETMNFEIDSATPVVAETQE